MLVPNAFGKLPENFDTQWADTCNQVSLKRRHIQAREDDLLGLTLAEAAKDHTKQYAV